MIVIPAIDIMDGHCVRLTRGEKESRTVYDADPVDAAKRWADAGARRIHVVDLDGAFDGASRNLAAIERIAHEVPVLIQVGGGIRTRSAVETLIGVGVSFVVIGTLVVEDPGKAAEIVEDHPGKIYIGIDARAGMVATRGWVRTSDHTITEVAERANEWKARGIIFTAIERDGELVGPDFDAIEEMLSQAHVPMIASGGVSTLDDIARLAQMKRIEGVIVGKALYEGRIDAKAAIKLQDDVKPSGGGGLDLA